MFLLLLHLPILLYRLCGISCQESVATCSNATITTATNALFCSGQPCHLSSLDALFIPPHLEQSTVLDIVLCAGSSDLSTGMEFADILEVRLRGEGEDASSDWAEVHCQGNSTGIRLTRVHTVHLERITLRGCGISLLSDELARASLVIMSSDHVTMTNMILSNPAGMGTAMIDVANSNINNCTFEHDGCEEEDASFGESGLYVEANNSTISFAANSCKFIGSCKNRKDITPCWDQGAQDMVRGPTFRAADHLSVLLLRGGGIRVLVGSHSSRNSISVTDCVLEGNVADWGGGVYIGIQDQSTDNVVTLSTSNFSGNCARLGGGAIAMGLLNAHSTLIETPPTNNTISIAKCNFTGNTALAGGAVQVSYFELESTCKVSAMNEIQFDNCKWADNTAHDGAAIDIRPLKTRPSTRHVFQPPLVTLMDCKFERNMVKWIRDRNVWIHGKGTVKLVKTELRIKGSLHMEGGTGSALYLESTNADFERGSESFFAGNKGYRGGAIAMAGVQRSGISVGGNINFKNNQAENVGGAIHQEASDECFISGSGKRKSLLKFTNNTAQDGIGHSIFVNSLRACFEATKTGNYLEAFDSIARFEFVQNRSHEVATLGSRILSAALPPVVIPGKSANLSVYALDDTNATLLITAIKISTINSPNIDLTVGFSQDTRNNIKILGRPGSEGQIRIAYYHRQEVEFVVNVTLSACPPGYYYSEHDRSCVCSVQSESNRYIGIQACKHEEYRASLLHSHWAGYIKESRDEENVKGSVFKTAYCPRGYCARSNKTDKDVLLPSHVEGSDLSSFVCRENRVGKLCSKCTANHSTYFPRIACHREDRCNLGGLLYILSQIIPVTIVFSLLLAFDINLTSGWLNGVILYMQMFDALVLTANDFLWFEPPVYKILRCLRVITRATNLHFFALEGFSFCIWKGATALDMFVFNYVTIVYSFLLVTFTVKLASPLIHRIKKHCKRKGRISSEQQEASSSIIHGLIGFLVLCYSQSTHTSLNLLAYVSLHGRGSREEGMRRVFYMGELGFFTAGHLPYAIPATLMLISITVLPPILLLMYPLCYKVLAVCRLQESKVTKILCRVIPLERYKPFFDSFQGSFRDDHRYFAGLYFAYRLMWLITLAYVRELATFYLLLEMQLVLMLALNAYVQPYKEKWHNRSDTCIFALLALINGCTVYSYHKRNDYTHPSNYIQITNTIQIVLACLPFFCVAGFLARQSAGFAKRKLRERRRRREPERDIEVDTIEMLTSGRREEDLVSSTSVSYKSSVHYKKLPNTK